MSIDPTCFTQRLLTGGARAPSASATELKDIFNFTVRSGVVEERSNEANSHHW